MSINILKKKGEWVRKNQGDIAIVIGFVLVAAIAFGAGRLSAPEIIRNPIVIEEPNSTSSINLFGNVSQPPIATEQGSAAATSEKGLFVASRGGTKYHWSWCSWGQRIKTENQIWFNSEAQAQAAGYSPCACIKNKAPAGYSAK
ncbi:MAG: Copper amine oxidase domain-containing protein [Parcubacteria group bacterium LiPW_39]|nr:MAG: Copper amine oxidase domain-containing protein [Parcubacteria group bacterium LiPW_39]